ncbi:EamA family transporter [Actinomadura scrupuli]|uniref:EamA family transporter n=1 Tax=Actinomadura scrupuli TaxID=559629 RepID=UPI003D98E228
MSNQKYVPRHQPGGTSGRRPILGTALTLAGRLSAIGGGVVSVWLLTVLPPLVIAGLEAGVGAVMLLLWSLRSPVRDFLRQIKRHVDRALRSTTASILALALTNVGVKVGFVYAVASIPLGMVNALYYSAPLIVSVIEGWRRDSGRAQALAWPLLAATGVAVLTEFWTGDVNLFGIVCGLIAGVCRALSLPISRSHIRKGKEEIYTAAATAISAAAILIWALLMGEGLAPAWATGTVGLVLICAAISTFVPQLLQLTARRFVSDSVYGILLCLSPVLGAVLGLLFLHQPVTLVQGIGIITITVAAIGAVRHDSR